MALFSYDSLQETILDKMESYDYLNESSNMSMEEATSLDSLDSITYDKFDIFLSHSYQDRKIIPSLKKELENMGFKVYVDWINDRFLNRDEVNKKTADMLQIRMKQSKCLLYATSDNSKDSRWMPWELGYFDGTSDKMVGILPIKHYKNNFKNNFKGEEYLSLYCYIDENRQQNTGNNILWVNEDSNTYVAFDKWLDGEKPYRR